MWAYVQFCLDKEKVTVPLSHFKETFEGRPPTLVVGNVYRVFWSSDPNQTPDALMNLEGKIIDVDKELFELEQRRRSRKKIQPLKGFYEATLLLLDESEEALNNSIDRKRLRTKVDMGKSSNSSRSGRDKDEEASRHRRRERAEQLKNTDEASKKNIVDLLAAADYKVPKAATKKTKSDSSDEFQPSLPSSDSESSESGKKRSQRKQNVMKSEDNWQAKFKKQEKEWKVSIESMSSELRALRRKYSALRDENEQLKKDLAEKAEELLSRQETLLVTPVKDNIHSPATKRSSNDFSLSVDRPFSYVDAVKSRDDLGSRKATFVTSDKQSSLWHSPSPTASRSKSPRTPSAHIKSPRTPSAHTKSPRTPSASSVRRNLSYSSQRSSSSLSSSSSKKTSSSKKKRDKRYKFGEDGDSMFVKDNAGTFWKPEELRVRRAGSCDSDEVPDDDGRKGCTSKKRKLESMLRDRILQEEPNTSDREVKRRLSKVTYFLGEKIGTLRKAQGKKSQSSQVEEAMKKMQEHFDMQMNALKESLIPRSADTAA